VKDYRSLDIFACKNRNLGIGGRFNDVNKTLKMSNLKGFDQDALARKNRDFNAGEHFVDVNKTLKMLMSTKNVMSIF
jgi:hypothetical protein